LRRHLRPLVLSGLTGLVLPGAAYAQFDLTTGAAAQYEHDSNVFALPKDTVLPAPFNTTNHGSAIETYTASLEPTYQWSREKLDLDLQGRDVRFDDYSALNHTEYALRANLTWASGAALDGTLGANRERRMVRFTDALSTQLLIETENKGTAGLNVWLSPYWRIEANLMARRDDSPRPGLPTLSLGEHSGELGLKFIAVDNVSVGLTSEYLSGSYSGITPDTIGDPSGAPIDYHQVKTQLVADRKISKDDLFEAAIGYTTRSLTTPTSDVAAVTGSLLYKRELTGKTSIDVGVSREVNAYISTTSAELDDIAHLELEWHATAKIDVEVGGAWNKSKFPGWVVVSGPINTPVISYTERNDTAYESHLSLSYRPIKQITVRPFIRLENRTSNIDLYNYSATMYGVEIRGQVP